MLASLHTALSVIDLMRPEHHLQVPLAATTGSLMLGGSSTFLLNLARVFGRRGWRLPIVVLSQRIEHREDFSGTSAEISGISTARHIYEDRLAWGYRQVARVEPHSVLACLSAESFEILRLVPPGVVRLGIIQSHDPGPYRLASHFAPWLDAIVGVSSEICGHLRAMPELAGLRVESIPYGIDFQPSIDREPTKKERPLRVVYLGRLVEVQKRVSRLVSLIQTLDQERANVQFTVIGSGPDENRLKAALAQSTMVQFRGTIPNAEVAGILREQDVYVLLSDFEGLPLSLLEAMAEGVVPLVSDLPSGLREVVTPQIGLRVPVGDVQAAAGAIQHLAEHRQLLARLSENAMRLARKEYSADRMVDRFLSLIEDLDHNRQLITWPPEAPIQTPELVRHRWLFRGWPRKVRRWLKGLSMGSLA
jgi:glycosyltransferase involved in cell wall biosynthesis